MDGIAAELWGRQFSGSPEDVWPVGEGQECWTDRGDRDVSSSTFLETSDGSVSDQVKRSSADNQAPLKGEQRAVLSNMRVQCRPLSESQGDARLSAWNTSTMWLDGGVVEEEAGGRSRAEQSGTFGPLAHPHGSARDQVMPSTRSATVSLPSRNHNMGHKSEWKGSPDCLEMADKAEEERKREIEH
ncbi:hypothetical protein EYF80_015429 [Liparis tanakae]|uniref:Uncharacterized protein n=1 Tax=Liparis tanakae TaxID=230148 RepID=A0A4Z2I8J5_9TELE|nr:hypothetical protein EYF80_015429 [Liparis tanakae]